MVAVMWMNDYMLLQPDWLLLIPLVPAFLLLNPWLRKHGWLNLQNHMVSAIPVRHPQAGHYQVRDSSDTSGNVILTGISSCLLVLALAQPVRLGEQIEKPVSSADVMLIIDTSISMVMKDYLLDGQRVNRMTMTRALLDRFTMRFSGRRIGIVVLGEQPQILLRPSEDKALVRFMIHQLRPTISGRQAALGDAIAVTSTFIGSEKVTDETVMVLISSADAPGGKLSPVSGVERAIENGVILHTIAIGSTDVQASEFGELIFEPADVGLLQQLADMTGGKSFHAVDVAAMDAALNDIEQHHKIIPYKKFAPRKQQTLYHLPLLAGLLLLMLMALLPHRGRKKSSHKKFSHKKSNHGRQMP